MWSQWLRPGAEDGAIRGGHDQDHRHVGIEGKHVRGSGDAAGNRGARRGYWTAEREDVFIRTGGGWTDGILRVSVSPKVPVSKGCERCWLFGIRAASMATVLRPEQKPGWISVRDSPIITLAPHHTTMVGNDGMNVLDASTVTVLEGMVAFLQSV